MFRLADLIYNPKKILKNSEVHGDTPSAKEAFSRVFKVAWPCTIEAFLVALVGMVDTLMVSNLGESAVAAIGLTGNPKIIGLCFFMATSVAVSAIVARRRGENDSKGATKTLYNAMGVTIIATLIISAVSVVFAEPILRFIGSNADTHDMATEYLQIVMACIIFQTITMTINAAQRGCGNTKVVMRCNLVSNGVNLVFNYLLIHGNFGFPALGVVGAAIATVLGTVVAMVMAIVAILPGKSFVAIKDLNFFKFEREVLKGIFNVATPTIAEQLFMRFGFLVATITTASLGTIAFAAHQVASNILMLAFSFADGLSIAAVALVGRSLGQKRPDLARLYGAMCQRIGVGISIIFALIFQFLGPQLFGLFSDRSDILDYGRMLTALMSIAVLMQLTQFIYSGCLRGAGDTRYTAFASMISVGLIRPIVSYILCYPLGLGLAGIWFGMIFDQFVRMLFATIRFKKGNWTRIKI